MGHGLSFRDKACGKDYIYWDEKRGTYLIILYFSKVGINNYRLKNYRLKMAKIWFTAGLKRKTSNISQSTKNGTEFLEFVRSILKGEAHYKRHICQR